MRTPQPTRLGSFSAQLAVWVVCALGVVPCLTGCEAEPPPRLPGPQLTPLNQLQDGHTTRVDALMMLGVPSAVFDGGRVLTYRVSSNGKEVTEVSARVNNPGGRISQGNGVAYGYSVVLMFDDAGVLVGHNVITLAERVAKSDAADEKKRKKKEGHQ